MSDPVEKLIKTAQFPEFPGAIIDERRNFPSQEYENVKDSL